MAAASGSWRRFVRTCGGMTDVSRHQQGGLTRVTSAEMLESWKKVAVTKLLPEQKISTRCYICAEAKVAVRDRS